MSRTKGQELGLRPFAGREAAVITAEPRLAEVQAELAAATEPLREIADREQEFWTSLAGVLAA